MNSLKTFLLLFVLGTCISTFSFSQPDSGLNFQAVARDASGELIDSEKLDIQISIQKPSIIKGGPPATYYQEQHDDVLTDKYGVFSLVIGTGSPLAGTFNNLNWVDGNFQVFISIKFPGSTSFNGIGTVPLQMNYKAYHANIADSVVNASLGGLKDVTIYPSILNSGDILNWDGSKWVTATPPTVSRKLFLGPMNFAPAISNSGFYKHVTGAKFSNGTTPIFMPINLPVGSHITGIKAHFLDNSSSDFQIKLYWFYEVTNGISTIASYTSSGSSSAYQQQAMTITYGSRIVPDNYFIYVEVKPKTGGSWDGNNLRMRGVEIEYTIPQ